MNEGLFSAYTTLPEWKELLQKLCAPGCTALGGLTEGERAFFAAALAHRTGRPVLLLSPTELVAQKQAQDVNRLFGGGAAALPTRDVQFSRAASSQESTWQRLQVLGDAASGKLRVLCVSAEAAVDRCVPAARYRAATIRLSDGERFAPERLIEHLLRAGYERVPMVEGKGQCAMRGAILDVFPPSENDALRIEFFDDEVDSIRRFDCISQRSIERVHTVHIGPATECLIDDPEAAANRLREALRTERPAEKPQKKSKAALPESDTDELPPLEIFLEALDELDAVEEEQKPDPAEPPKPMFGGTRSLPADNSDTRAAAQKEVPRAEREQAADRRMDDVDVVRQGYPIRTGPMWLNVLCGQTATAADYLNDPIVLCDQPDQLQMRVKSKRTAFDEDWTDAERRGDAFAAQRDLLWTYDELIGALKAHSVAVLSDMTRGMGMLEPTSTLGFESTAVPQYQSRLEPLCKDIKTWKEQGCAIVLLTGGEARGHRLQRALADQGMPCAYSDTLDGNAVLREVLLLPATLNKGFRHERAQLVVVSDADLFGSHYTRARKKQSAGERIASFTDLKNGDYVVHETHGVGIFDGVVQMSSEGVKRDYLLIRYAGNDKLYVPTDQFDRVQKFIGAEQNPPKLNRLGGGEWEKQKNKVKAGLKKLAFDLAQLYARRQTQPGYAFAHETPWQREFEDGFPYELTVDQQQSVEQIEADMESPRNMDRLLCGDVGYGKTEVALRAAFKAVIEGKQAAILAPTTILVQQHYNTAKKRFAGFPVTVEMLSRFRSPKEQKEIKQRLESGEIDLIIGTHQLLSKDVKFKDLGLLIVDEEHRFGVNHKESIKQLKTRVDVLTLSATPIPRTLHMSMVGIRDMSILETPPEERLPVKTSVIEYDDRIVQDAIKRELARGGQVYFLYNRVRSIEQMHARLQALVPEARIAVAHGQMRENALEDVMLDFYAGSYDVLLCTTIVESGLDVPEANTLIVFDADHFGLSQLYQLRGRVGRSSRQAYAYFTVRRNRALSETAQKRLSAIQEFTEFGSGYRIAMRDLEIRGAGDVLGPEQHGHLSAVGYDMYVKLIEQAVGEAQGKLETPELDTRVELQIDAFLPGDYVPEEKLRVEVYKRIAMIEDANTRADIEEELVDRFGDVPEPVTNLMNIAQLRAITRRLGVSRLFLRPDGLHLRLEEKFLPAGEILFAAVQQTDPRLAFSRNLPPELLLRERGLTPETALKLAIDVLARLLARVTEQTAALSCESQKSTEER